MVIPTRVIIANNHNRTIVCEYQWKNACLPLLTTFISKICPTILSFLSFSCSPSYYISRFSQIKLFFHSYPALSVCQFLWRIVSENILTSVNAAFVHVTKPAWENFYLSVPFSFNCGSHYLLPFFRYTPWFLYFVLERQEEFVLGFLLGKFHTALRYTHRPTKLLQHLRTSVTNVSCVLYATFWNFISADTRLDYHCYFGTVCNKSENIYRNWEILTLWILATHIYVRYIFIESSDCLLAVFLGNYLF